jgi:RNase P subunit RPR2
MHIRLLCENCKNLLKYRSIFSRDSTVDILVEICKECKTKIIELRKEKDDGEREERDEFGP